MLNKVEKWIFFVFLFSVPFQTRVFLYSAGAVEGFDEWQSVFLYGTDVLILLLLGFWVFRAVCGRKDFLTPNRAQTERAWCRFRRLFPDDRMSSASSERRHPALSLVGSASGGDQARLRSESSSGKKRLNRRARASSSAKSSLGILTRVRSRKILATTLVIFIVAAGISIFFAPYKVVGVYRWLKLVEMAGLFFYIGSILKRVKFSNVLAALGAGGIFQGAVAIGQFLTQRSLGLRLLGEPPLVPGAEGVAEFVAFGGRFMRSYGTTPSPNVLAAFLAISLFSLITWFLAQKEYKKGQFLFAAGGSVIISLGLLFTFSRIIMAITVFVLFIYVGALVVWRPLRKYLRKGAPLFIFLAAAATTFGALYWREIFGRFWDYRNYSDTAIAERAFFNKIAGQFLAANPNGIGLGNFTLVMRQVMGGLRENLYQPVHNIFLLIGVEAGSVALAAFLVFVLVLLFVATKNLVRKKTAGSLFLLVSFVFIILSGFFDHFYLTLQQGSLLFWVVAGMIYYGQARSASKDYTNHS